MQLYAKGKPVTIARVVEAIRFRIDYYILRKVDKLLRPRICDDVARWAIDHGISVTRLHDSIPYQKFPTEVYRVPENDLFSGAGQDLEKPQVLIVTEHSKLRGATGVMYLPDGNVCLQNHWWKFLLELNNDYTVIRRRYRKVYYEGNVYSLLCTFGQHYFHWLHDVLPRLYTTLPHLPSDTRFLVNRKLSQFQTDCLSCFGISIDRLVYQDDRDDAVIEKLWFSTPLGNNYFTAPFILNKVGEALRNYFRVKSVLAFRRLYISRRRAANRRIVNEADFRPALEARGFDLIDAETMSFSEQVHLFSEANIVVSPHGAGLVNMLFMPKGGRVIEILETNTLYAYYWIMSGDCGHHYQPIVGDTVSNGDHQPDIWVDPARLMIQIDKAISQCSVASHNAST